MPRSFALRIAPLLTLATMAALAACAGDAPPPAVARGARPTASSSPPPVASAPAPPRLRLPDGVRPLKNTATLTVVPSRETFEGEMQIELEASSPLPLLWLNADGLTIDRASASASTGGGAKVDARVVPGGKNFVGLAFDTPLPAGTSVVRIAYHGALSATEVDGASRQKEGGDWYVYTHFEPLAARRVFPCFDEPAFKVPWQLTLRIQKGDTALANTPALSTEEGKDGLTTVRFAETKPLPSYLIAFAVGPFGIVDAGKTGVGNTQVRVITPRGKESWARFAVKSTGPVLALLEKYFGRAYPYEKLDVIAVPLFGGAMENPGLITFRQSLILSKPDMESTGFRRAYASVAAHELAHIWFGDLVTTAWWDDLWLNEAFATWMTPKIMEQYRPDWDAPSGRAQSANGAMRSDSLVSARQIRQPVTSNDDIKNAFDGITYQKGAAVITMFERWVGASAFQKGVQRYMSEHAHGTATARDFLAAVTAEAKQDVAAPFSTFLDQPGVPSVAAEVRCDGGKPRLALSQTRYLPVGSEGGTNGKSTSGTPWQVPVCTRFSIAGKVDRACTLLGAAPTEMPLKACPDWVLPNDSASGYYRTAYGSKLLEGLTTHLEVLSAAEKIALVGDLSAHARAGKLDYAAILPLVPALAKDKSAHVVAAAAGVLGSIRDTPLINAAARPRYAKFVQDALGGRARALGVRPKAGEDEEARWLRPIVIDLVADQGEDAALRAECTTAAKAWLSDKSAVAPELIGTTLGIAASFGDRELFDAFVADAKKTPERADRDRLIAALGQFRDPALVAAALALTLGNDFDPRESIRILYGATRMPETAPLAYLFLTKNFDALVSHLPRDWAAGAPGIGAALCDDTRRAELQAFFQDRAPKFVGGPRSLAQSIEGMHLCSTFKAAQSPGVTAFFTR
jgi:cytosol alanyl aminopeptidase